MDQATKIKVYYLSSGKIGIPVLDALAQAPEIDLVGIGTQVDRPAGRKRKLHPTPVGEWAEQHDLAVDKVPNVNDESFLASLKQLAPDFIFVVSFGQLLKADILNLPTVCCLNLHASLLPAYRGASPIVTAMLNGEEKTGVAFMEMEKGLDTGPVFCCFDYPVSEDITADDLEMALGELGAQHTASVLTGILNGELKPRTQNHDEATYAHKIHKKAGHITWQEEAETIQRMTRAYHPWPGVFFEFSFNDKEYKVKINKAAVINDMQGQPGEILEAGKKRWIVACGRGAVSLEQVVPQGRKMMSGADFLRGHQLKQGMVLTL